MTEPHPTDLIEFVIWLQPELDRDAAASLLINPDIWDGVAQQRRNYLEYSRALLEHHLLCHG